MKYKIGDRVRIISGETEGLICWNKEMNAWLGKTMTISEIVLNGYAMKEDDGTWLWYDDMIAGFAGPELTAIEVLQIMKELPFDFVCDFLNLKHYRECYSREYMLTVVATPEETINMCQQWKSEHEKKAPKIETVDICRIIEIFPDGRKRCVHEEDIKLDPELPYSSERLAVEEMLKSYCMEHEGKFIAVHEVVSRVKAVN